MDLKDLLYTMLHLEPDDRIRAHLFREPTKWKEVCLIIFLPCN